MTKRFSFLEFIELQELFRTATPQIPGRFRRQTAQIHGIEITPRREHIVTSTGWRSGRTAGDPPAGSRSKHGVMFTVGTVPQARPEVGLDELQGARQWV